MALPSPWRSSANGSTSGPKGPAPRGGRGSWSRRAWASTWRPTPARSPAAVGWCGSSCWTEGGTGDRDRDAGANQPPRSGTPSATSAGAQGRLSGEETLVLGEAAGPHGGLGPAVLGRPNGSS
ncbi:unnamed protein product [Prorocentrum cordatum]|uniref:Uncharacterized protein n=1 Tax=Prorocentrum cordatum TaxID=2364126 RepID=A0ABN9PTX2_9DINO|nr:unnamed protein product [Polarella glacialis]